MTNFDRIKEMKVGELMDMLRDERLCTVCALRESCETKPYGDVTEWRCFDGISRYLFGESEAEDKK